MNCKNCGHEIKKIGKDKFAHPAISGCKPEHYTCWEQKPFSCFMNIKDKKSGVWDLCGCVNPEPEKEEMKK